MIDENRVIKVFEEKLKNDCGFKLKELLPVNGTVTIVNGEIFDEENNLIFGKEESLIKII